MIVTRCHLCGKVLSRVEEENLFSYEEQWDLCEECRNPNSTEEKLLRALFNWSPEDEIYHAD